MAALTKRSEKGSALGIVMVYVFVFTLTGMVFLTICDQVILRAVEEKHRYQNMFSLESGLSRALWYMNVSDNNAGNFTDGPMTSSFTDSTMTLKVSIDRWNQSQEIYIGLDYDHAFSNTFFTTTPIDTSGGSISFTSSEGISMEVAPSLPTLDTNYYINNAVAIYNDGAVFSDSLQPGIHYVRSGVTELKNNAYLEGTLILMGKLKVVGTNVKITAGKDTAGNYLPAMIVADSVSTTDITDIIIEGAIISYGYFELKSGYITGPFIGNDLDVQNSLVIDNAAGEAYYTYYDGFAEFDSSETALIIQKGTWRQNL